MRPPSLSEAITRRGARIESGSVIHFGDPAQEAAAAFEAGVLRDQSARARIAVLGAERADFVNRMCTNDVKVVRAGHGVAAVLTNVKGRIVDLVRVFEQDGRLVLLGSDGNGDALRAWLSKFVVMEELRFDDLAATEACLLAFGPAALAAVNGVLGTSITPRASGFEVARASFEGAAAWVLGPGDPLHPGLEIVAPGELAGPLFARLVDAGLRPIGEQAWEQVRIESGIPRAGRELTENVNPLEASLLPAVSFTKGCYLGQEVVARLNSYAKVQRRLVGARFPASVDPADVKEIFWDLLRIGHATSVTRSPRLAATVALAFVKTEYAGPGTPVYTVRDGEHVQGVLAATPFA